MSPHVRRPPFPPSPDRIGLAGLRDLFHAAGLVDRTQQIADALAVLNRLDADASGLDARVNLTEQETIFAIIRGEVSVVDAALKLDAARRLAEASGAVPRLVAKVRGVTTSIVIQSLFDAGDALLTEIDQQVQIAVTELHEASARVGNVRSDQQAGRASTEQQQSWKQMHNAVEKVNACWRLAGELQRLEFVPSVAPAAHIDDVRFRHPDKLDRRIGDEPMVVWMARQVSNGAAPAVVSASDYVNAVAAAEAEAQARRSTRSGRLGPPAA